MTEELLIFVNGERASSVHAMDRGLQYGDGVFRTMKVRNAAVRWWADQYQKLSEDCAALGISPPEERLLLSEVNQIVGFSGVGVVKVIVTRGAGQRGYAISTKLMPTRIVMGLPPTGRENLEVRVRWCDLRLSHQPKLAGVKHLNRLENVLARSEWDDADIAEGLIQDEEGNVICGTITNLIIVEQGKFITPDLSYCGVAGVARERIIKTAQRLGQPVFVEKISRERLMAADEVLLCNSLVDVWRVAELEEKHWPDSGWAEKLRNWLNENN